MLTHGASVQPLEAVAADGHSRQVTMKRLLIACGLAAAGVAAVAQPPDLAAVAKNAGQKARENAVALKQYGWTMRVAVTLKGEPIENFNYVKQ